MASGRVFERSGDDNPAYAAWRSGAALAAEELQLARGVGVAGMVTGGDQGLALLRESVAVLGPAIARLEHARSLVELGAALRRAGRRAESREYLRLGVEQAEVCGAVPLAEQGRTELRAAGARARSQTLLGITSLTPSELRVAELATAGGSNRDIAQALFVTTKTVEVHLTNAYRKLGITRRTDLAAVLPVAT